MNQEVTARSLAIIIKRETGVTLSIPAIQHHRRALGWRPCRTRNVQQVRDANKKKRMKFCQDLIDDNEDFNNVIFTDESTVSMNRFGKLSFYKVCYDEYGKRSIEVEKLMAGIPKHPHKAGISCKGPTPIVIFSGIMDRFNFTKVLESGLLPFIKDK